MAEDSSLYRGFYVWAIGTAVVLGFFLAFVLAGWPGSVNTCVFGSQNPPPPDSILAPPANNAAKPVKDAYLALKQKIATTNTCYCESFDVVETYRGAPGVRQHVNTWFNLYSIATALWIAFCIYYDRRDGASNMIGSGSWIPDLYIFAVLFLGLGSMWFHAAIKEWAGVFDDLSMYFFAVFLVFYTIHRLWNSDIFFWLGYAGTVIGVTVVGEFLSLAHPGATISLFAIVFLVLVYCFFEFWLWSLDGSGSWIANWWDHFSFTGSQVKWRWWCAVACILVAAFFQITSQTGSFLCNSGSSFQPHGLLWHPLAGAMAVFLYFYWKYDTVE